MSCPDDTNALLRIARGEETRTREFSVNFEHQLQGQMSAIASRQTLVLERLDAMAEALTAFDRRLSALEMSAIENGTPPIDVIRTEMRDAVAGADDADEETHQP